MRLKFFCPYLLASVCHHLLQKVASEVSEMPIGNQDLYLELFDESVVHRQNFCAEQQKYQNGTIDINLALEGRHVNVALGPDLDFLNRNINGSLPGLMAVLMDEVAERGKFTWRDSYIIHSDNVPSGKTWTDLCIWLIDHYDVAVWFWYQLYSREALGISFPKGWYDGSIIIIAKQEDNDFLESFSPFSWSRPFTPGVWLLLLITMIVTGYVTMQLDPKAKEKDETRSEFFMSNVYSSLIVFTGHLDLDPNTRAGELVSFSLSFFAMLMLSAYTANLASFLVAEKASRDQVNTVNDIVRMKKSMCIYEQSGPLEAIKKIYNDSIFVEKGDDKKALLGLKNDECNYAIVGQSTWDNVSLSQII